MGSPVTELSAFCRTMQEFKSMVGALVEEKRKGTAGAELVGQGRRCVLKLAEVRKVNRDAHEAADRVVAAADAERSETDIVSQQLQNLQYQKIHLSRELQICLSYKGCEDLELISEEEFEACTPEEQRGGTRGSHAYELARLTAEMKKREEMIKSVKQQDLRRKLYQGKLQTQRKFLDSLQSHLENVHVAAEPVRKEFTKTGPLPSLDSATAATAQLLPAPLYSIYYQAHAYEVNFGQETTVAIEGDLAAAQAFLKSLANIPTTPHAEPEDSKKRKRRKGEEREEKSEDVTAPHPLTVHIKINPTAGSKAPTLSLVFSYLHTLQVVTVKHTLKPELGSSTESGAILQDLFPNDSGELAPLVSADYILAGAKYLKGAGNPGMRSGVLVAFDDALTHGRAYKWAQRVASLRYPPRDRDADSAAAAAAAVQAVTPRDNVDKKEVSDERNALEPLAYGTLVAKLRQRVEISFQVRAILSELQGLARGAKGQSVALPNVPGANDMPAYGAVVTGWVDVTKEVLAAQAAAEGTEDDMDVERERRESEREQRAADGGDEEGEVLVKADAPEPVPKSVIHPTEKHASELARKGHRFFRATISKTVAAGSTWLVQADVEVAAGYPKAVPVWTLKVVQSGAKKLQESLMPGTDPTARAAVAAARQRGEETNTQLRSIEAELNVYAAPQAAAHGCPGAKLLIYQLWMAVHCVGMYVDAESGAASLPTTREHRGRDRRLPFLWNAVTHTLEQRS